jgi:spoIIIJ-associated protein
MKELEAEGKTVQVAIENGLKELGLAREDVDVKVLSEGKTGLFGLMGASPAKVKIISRKPAAESAGRKPHGASVISRGSSEVQTTAADELRKILQYMKLEASVNSQLKESGVYLDIVSRDSALIIGKHGNTINSLQLILNMLVRQKTGETANVVVDTAGYRVRRERLIERTALQAVKDAVATGNSVPLEPMNSSERKLVHMLLKDNPDVFTNSEGAGAIRRVVISPKNQKTSDEP